jgi:phage gp46-like protein
MSESAQFYLPAEPVAASSRTLTRKAISDVAMRHTADGGEIDFVNGAAVLSDGLYTAVYVSLFGGNERDSGRAGDRLQWWGNLTEADPVRHYRSETQHLLRSIPAIPFNLRRIEDAVKTDLAWLLSERLARSLEAAVTIPKIHAVLIVISGVLATGEKYRLEYGDSWGMRT